MRDFGSIERGAESRAMDTLFFRDSVFEGKTCKASTANYLAFLSLRGPEIAEEVTKLRQALSEPSSEHLEHDLSLLLRARNWRFHNIACLAIAATGGSSKLLSELWNCIRRGSWTSPQLAATAAYVDPEFSTKAGSLVENHETYYKSIVSLAALLAARTSYTADLSPIAQTNIAEATQIDRDNSGAIAIGWHKNLREAFSAA